MGRPFRAVIRLSLEVDGFGLICCISHTEIFVIVVVNTFPTAFFDGFESTSEGTLGWFPRGERARPTGKAHLARRLSFL
jgi:hypothetical protein